MPLSYDDLDFTLSDDMLIVSCPTHDVHCFCELNDIGDRIDRTWVTGCDTPGRRHVARQMIGAGVVYLDGLRLSESL